MNKERLSYLYQQYLIKALTFDEEMEWKALLADPNLDRALEQVVDAGWYNYSNEELITMKRASVEEISNYILKQPQNGKVKRSIWTRIAIAASILITLSAGLYFYTSRFSSSRERSFAHENDIAPGKNTATLTLADGRKILLSDAVNGQLARESNVSIVKTADGQVIYKVIPGSDNGAKSSVLLYNTLSTAKGETFHIKLPDGSDVWLNAASTLKYPASFVTLKERRVELEGEAYFEVTKDKTHPFLVGTSKQVVQVLGTHFNINSYSDESSTKTTLLEGEVRVSPQDPELPAVVITPGQQSALGHTLSVANVDVNSVVDWKNGEFIFNDENLESILRKVSRWYNLEVIYENEELRKQAFGGEVSRFGNVSDVLDVLELTGFAHFKIEGRRIIVRK